jgi:hypothetical protein
MILYEKCIQNVVRKPVMKRPLSRPRLRGEDDIKMDLVEITWKSVDWIYEAHDRDRRRSFVDMVMKLWVS